ncbi:MAG: N-acetylmuramoyl-L-alanine amidase [Proteobacteria bacterium]|nr:N-acetylmuramoyl-L-alanine amidase [Pseudomonadota bacterium]MBW3617806.1 N-acetylmuramoyl-L-alanine amidase [Pseudomonadota bacterium]
MKVRVAGTASETRVVVELDQAAKARLIEGQGARSLVLAWPDLETGKELSGPGKGLVSAWTVDEAAGAARLKLSLTEDAQIARRFLLPPGDGVEVYRYVVDLKPKAKRVPAKLAVTSSPAGPAANAKPEMLSAPRRAAGAKRVVVIDAGHGGKDPGAIGVHAREGAVTLAAAKALRARLQRGGYKVVLTREKDVFLPLETRVRIARQAHADLFISLHADAGGDPGLKGASVYTLSENGSDRVAKKVMARDRSLGEVKLPGQDAAVNSILLDLTQRATRNQSATFAQLLLNEVDDVCALLRRSHRDAGFVVLLAPDVPAVLLEMGFMTNTEDERLLTDPKHRTAMMDAVGDGIDAYFAQAEQYAAR